ncbi:MAG: hypothetical protein ACJA1C_002490 [Crocinitomicaceae bacterium]|jgi:hypothetical protein
MKSKILDVSTSGHYSWLKSGRLIDSYRDLKGQGGGGSPVASVCYF